MVEYCLRIKVPRDQAGSYESWLEGHSQTITNQPGFQSCHVLSGPCMDEPGWTIFHVRYQIKDEESFEAYLKGPAQKLRQEGLDIFGPFVTIQRDLIRTTHRLSHQGAQ